MSKTVKEINELLKATRDQKFRKLSQTEIDRRNAAASSIAATYQDPEKRRAQSEKAKYKKSAEHGKKLGDSLRGKSRKGEPWVDKMRQTQMGNSYGNKSIMSPYGEFPSKKQLVDYMYQNGLGGKTSGNIDRWLKTKPDQYYYIKGKDDDKKC